MKSTENKRLLALDIMRGMTIAGMILVNNAGNWASAFEPLRHAKWNGFTPTDLVFPFFMFMMGVSTYMSLRKGNFSPTRATITKILRRAFIIFAIGIGLTWLSNFMFGYFANGMPASEAANSFARLRILGVLQRLALSYGAGALLAITLRHKWLPWVAGGLLAVYAVIMIAGDGFEYADSNIIARFDRAVLGANHMYTDYAFGTPLTLDPEGLLSTLPSVAHVLIGFICGSLICTTTDRRRQLNRLFIVGTIMTFTGLLFSYSLPINKKVWSPTFVLTTCGLAAQLLALLIWIIDVRGYRRWAGFFHAFGINPLYLYVQSAVLAYILYTIRVPSPVSDGTVAINGWVYYTLLDPLSGHNPQLASLLWALGFVLLNWIPGYILERRHVYIKI